jgi:aryl-alcohol dehydrogenase-like predicted oxidoreductase
MRFPHVFTAENVTAGVEQSLRRMKTDHLDLVQFHASPTMEQLEEHGALRALQDLKAAGKVRFIGMSGTIPNIKAQIDSGIFDEFQIPYSALEREHEALITAASNAGAGVVIRGGAAKGGPGKEEGNTWKTWQDVAIEDLIGDMSRQEFILRFTISHPDMDTTIVGTVNPSHLQDNVATVLKGPLPPELYTEAKRRLAMGGQQPIAVQV